MQSSRKLIRWFFERIFTTWQRDGENTISNGPWNTTPNGSTVSFSFLIISFFSPRTTFSLRYWNFNHKQHCRDINDKAFFSTTPLYFLHSQNPTLWAHSILASTSTSSSVKQLSSTSIVAKRYIHVLRVSAKRTPVARTFSVKIGWHIWKPVSTAAFRASFHSTSTKFNRCTRFQPTKQNSMQHSPRARTVWLDLLFAALTSVKSKWRSRENSKSRQAPTQRGYLCWIQRYLIHVLELALIRLQAYPMPSSTLFAHTR